MDIITIWLLFSIPLALYGLFMALRAKATSKHAERTQA